MTDYVGQFLGNYQLLRLLGRGAFAEVYLAEHRYLEVPAAIKVLHVRMEQEAHEQFLREARTIAHLQHAHIIRVHDFGFQEQTPFLVMEYTPNGTLRTRHPKGTRLPLEQVVHYVKQIASALDYAHEQHVIHRDVKPENMLLSANDEVVLSDFGLAVVQRSIGSLSTQNPAGTPIYMAPEQIRGKPTAASDQYALGVLVYEWLSGDPPFRGSLFEILSQHLHQPPPSLCARVPSLPLAIEDTVFGALAKEPQERFSSLQDFADVLEKVYDASQPLSLRLPTERLAHEQTSPFETLPAPIDAPSAKEEKQSSFSTQPLVLTQQHGEEREGRVALELLPSAAQAHDASSQQKGVRVSRTNRQRLLRKVRAYWITGVFEHSLHGAALIALGLQEQPDAIANPWQLVLHHPAGASRSLPAGTLITEVYDAAEGELLILGAPGSGKTTLLLELARDLLNRAEQDEQHPLPVVFNLASWASKQQPLTDWLVEELASTYQVPRKLGQTWVDADLILPLLDGLDEVAPKERTACIETINTYRGEHGLLPLVVCSRSADYLAQTARIRLESAVTVQPLTQQQVNDYLARGGEPLWALRVALQQDAALRELTSTPLMLSILTLTYHGVSVEEHLRGASISGRQRQIFEHYVERMLRQHGSEIRHTKEQTTHWLSWLARQMKQENQTVFYIEHLQPYWLPNTRLHVFYRVIVILFASVLSGLLAGLLAGVLSGLPAGLLFGLLGLLLSGLPAGLLIGLKANIEPTEVITWSPKDTGRALLFALPFGLLAGLIVAVLIVGLVVGPVVGPIVGWIVGLIVVLFIVFLVGLPFILLNALLGGASRGMLDTHKLDKPNQGIWRSARYGLLYGLVVDLVVDLVVVLPVVLFVELSGHVGQNVVLLVGQNVVQFFGLLFGFFGLLFGGDAFIQHFTLRWFLWRAGAIPWNYPRFLDYAAKRILLRKVGGGYIFVHRLLLEYFASLDGTPALEDSRKCKLDVVPVS